MDTVWCRSNEIKYAMLSAITNTGSHNAQGKTAVIYTAGQGLTSANYH